MCHLGHDKRGKRSCPTCDAIGKKLARARRRALRALRADEMAAARAAFDVAADIRAEHEELGYAHLMFRMNCPC